MPSSRRTVRIAIALVVLPTCAPTTGCGTQSSQAPVAQRRDAVEQHGLGMSYEMAFVPAPPISDGQPIERLAARLFKKSFPIQATGALLAPKRDAQGAPVTAHGSAVRSTCGATLLSPSYVLTAAHCVGTDVIVAPTDTVTLEMYRPTQRLAVDEIWRPKTVLQGSFPDFQHQRFTEEDGYFVDRYVCTIEARCGSTSIGCPSSDALSGASADVALLRCDGRPGDRYGYLDIAARDIPTAEVFVPWKHEVYEIPRDAPETSDLFQYYVYYDAINGRQSDNYHYLDRNQLLPLSSADWPDGTPRRKVAGNVMDGYVFTDVLGCHGTSGSGFLQQNPTSGAWEVLGPTAIGAGLAERLCQHVPPLAGEPNFGPGQATLGYTALGQSKELLAAFASSVGEDCALQPASFFTLGGRSGCQRRQSGLPFEARAVYTDFDPWLAPTLKLRPGVTKLGAMQVDASRPLRLAVRFVPVAGCSAAAPGSVDGGVEPGRTGNSGCPVVSVWVGQDEVLRRTVDASASRAVSQGVLFTASQGGMQEIRFEIQGSDIELGELTIVPNDEPNTFDTAYERTEAGLSVPGIVPPGSLPMRFVGDGHQGFEALLYPQERLVFARQAVALRGTWSFSLEASGGAGLSCGLLADDGSVLASAPCEAGRENLVDYAGSVAPIAAFIANDAGAAVEIDRVAIALARPAFDLCSNGVRDGNESDIDCGGSCSGCGDAKACLVGADCASGMCSQNVCIPGPNCQDGMTNGLETDVDCGGSSHCTPCGDGKACRAGSDCASSLCRESRCAEPACTDAVNNGLETDVDCGGTCGPCADAKECRTNTDCASALCRGGVCSAASCGDGLKNGRESDVDCGGGCSPCASAKACVVSSDCASRVCTEGFCADSSCGDHIRNGSESDVDCGGTCAACAADQRCLSGADCASGVCSTVPVAPTDAGVGPSILISPITGDTGDSGGLDAPRIGRDSGGLDAPRTSEGEAGGSTRPPVRPPPSLLRCAAPSCTDFVNNGDETDVDCGGATCPACVDGNACTMGSDCASGNCHDHVCTQRPKVQATLHIDLSFLGFYCASVTVTNLTTTPTTGWMVVFDVLERNVFLDWPASIVRNESSYTVRSVAANESLTSGESATFWFCAKKSGPNWLPHILSATIP